MKKAIIIIVYFGKLPKMFPLFLEGCRRNSGFNWLIYTDQECENVPQNVNMVKSSLEEVENLVKAKIDKNLSLKRAYKLCDYKVAYGLLFEDYITDYDYWGYGDLDVVYGDIDSFIRPKMDEGYDKIYTLGHLSLFRNTPEINSLFMDRNAKRENIRNCIEIMQCEKNGAYDERHGINELMIEKGFKVFCKIDCMDMGLYYDRIMCTAKEDMIFALGEDQPSIKHSKTNYKYQAFYYKDGRVYRVYYDNKHRKMRNEEFAYAHYRVKKYEMPTVYNSFWITKKGFINDSRLDKDPIEWISKQDIEALNSRGGIKENIKHYILNRRRYGRK